MVGADMQVKSRFSISTPWYHGWNIIAITMLIQAVTIGLMTYSFTLWILPFKAEFGAAQGTILIAASLSNACMGLYATVGGRLLDKFSTLRITIIGIVFYGCGFFLISVSTALWQIILLYATLLPIGGTLAGPLASQVLVARWFENNRGTALGISSIGTSIGGVFLPPLVAMLLVTAGWRMSHAIIAIVTVAVVIPALFLFVRDRNQNDIEPGKKHTVDADGNATVAPPPVFPDWKSLQIVKSKTLWVVVSFIGPMMFVMTSVSFNIAPISQEAGIEPRHAALLVSTMSLTMIFGKLTFGFLSDRIEHRNIIWVVAALMLLCLVLLQVASSFWPMILAVIFLGLASGGMMPVMGVIIASRYGALNFGRVNGMIAPFLTAFSFGPVLIGYLREGWESYEPIFFLLMFAAIPTAIGAFFLGSAVPEVPKVKGGEG